MPEIIYGHLSTWGDGLIFGYRKKPPHWVELKLDKVVAEFNTKAELYAHIRSKYPQETELIETLERDFEEVGLPDA